MKKTVSPRLLAPLLLLALFASAAPRACAEDAALLAILFPGDKQPKYAIMEFYDADAPATVESFEKLARKRFFNGMAFHRVFPHLLVQTGDPFSKERDRSKIGTGGPGYTLPAEIRRKHIAGAVAMSRLPDKLNPTRRSSGSQFYICLTPMPSLDGQYTVFAHITSGLDIIDQVSSAPSDTNDDPIKRILIKSIRILPLEEAEKEAQGPPPKVKRSRKGKPEPSPQSAGPIFTPAPAHAPPPSTPEATPGASPPEPL